LSFPQQRLLLVKTDELADATRAVLEIASTVAPIGQLHAETRRVAPERAKQPGGEW
jgi:hypothetical protein